MNSALFKYIRISSIALLFLGVIFLLFYVFFRSSISVTVNYEGFDPITTEVLINSETTTPQGEGANIYKKNLRPGGGVIEVAGPTVVSKKIEFSTSIFENKEIQVDDLEVQSAEQLAASLYGTDGSQNLSVFNAKLFDRNKWLAFQFGDNLGNGATIVANYKPETKSWTIVADGTDIDFAVSGLAEVPRELEEYVNGL